MIEYIDKVMSIPSCVSNAASKVNLLTKWIKMASPEKTLADSVKKQEIQETQEEMNERSEKNEEDKKKFQGKNEESINNYDCFDAFSCALNWESTNVASASSVGPRKSGGSRPKTGPGGRKSLRSTA